MVIGATALPPALGSCPLLPASTVWPPNQIFGTSHSLTSLPGVLASAIPMIRLLRWVLATLRKLIPNFFFARWNQVSLGSCMHCWDISELFLFFTFLFWALLYYYFSPLSSSVSLQFFSELFCSLTLLFCIKWATISRDKVVLLDEFMGFNIYLHDRGQFWPGLEMGEFIVFQSIIEKLKLPIQCVSTSGRVGLSYAKFLPRDTEWEGSFEVI